MFWNPRWPTKIIGPVDFLYRESRKPQTQTWWKINITLKNRYISRYTIRNANMHSKSRPLTPVTHVRLGVQTNARTYEVGSSYKVEYIPTNIDRYILWVCWQSIQYKIPKCFSHLSQPSWHWNTLSDTWRLSISRKRLTRRLIDAQRLYCLKLA